MPALTFGVGEFSYNGVNLAGPYATTEAGFKVNMDASGRTVKSVTHTIKVETYITADATAPTAYDVADQMEAIRKRLSHPGAELRFNGKGYGTLNVNAPDGTGVRDIAWGPRPEMLAWRPAGRAAGAHIAWTVSVEIPECNDAHYKLAIAEFCYRIGWTVDFGGYTRRTVAGFLRIAQSKMSATSTTLTDNADLYRARCLPDLPQGFRRMSADFSLDESKCKLDFSVVDEQLPPNAPPPGIVEVEAEHSVNSTGGYTIQWEGHISASYEVAADQPRALALNYFTSLIVSRILAARQNANLKGQPTSKTVMVRALSMRESVYSRKTASFSAQYVFTCALDSILSASGLWLPVPDSDYQTWRQSLNRTALANEGRGISQLRFQNSDEVLVNLCGNRTSVLTAGGLQPQLQTGNQNELRNAYPSPEGSYLHYQLVARVEVDDQVVVLKPLPALLPKPPNTLTPIELFNPVPQPDSPVQQGPGVIGAKIMNNQAGPESPYTPKPDTVFIQRRAEPTYYVYLTGRAVRAGYLIDVPVIEKVGGVDAVADNRPGHEFFDTFQGDSWFGVPLFCARWKQRFVLKGTPTGPIGCPPNPLGVG